MIFASDLDRTLIYSKRFVKKQHMMDNVVVDQIEERPISFMSRRAMELLTTIQNEITFVPVTTRTSKQFKRLSFSQTQKYAVINNGATLLINGSVDSEWKAKVESQKSKLSTSFESVKAQFIHEVSRERIMEVRIGDGYYWTFILNQGPHNDELRRWMALFEAQGWICEGTGKKIYLIPDFISKSRAFFFLKETYLTGNEHVIAAGDSLLDYDLLIHSDKSYVPKHGTLNSFKETCFVQTRQTGYKAGEEILERVWADIVKETHS